MSALSRPGFCQAKKVIAAFCYVYAASCYAQQGTEQSVTEQQQVEYVFVAQEEANGIDATQVALITEPTTPSEPLTSSIPATPAELVLQSNENAEALDAQDSAIAAAVADGVTTGLALSAGAIEMNPLVTTTPAGLVALTGMKIGLVKYAETLPVEEKRTVLKTSSALWGGAAANNLLVLLAAPPPVAVIAGLVTGFAIWSHMGEQYQKEDELIAARNKSESEANQALENTAPVSDLAVTETYETSGN